MTDVVPETAPESPLVFDNGVLDNKESISRSMSDAAELATKGTTFSVVEPVMGRPVLCRGSAAVVGGASNAGWAPRAVTDDELGRTWQPLTRNRISVAANADMRLDKEFPTQSTILTSFDPI